MGLYLTSPEGLYYKMIQYAFNSLELYDIRNMVRTGFKNEHQIRLWDSKWRALRDTFRKELRKITKKRSGDVGGILVKSTWAYLKDMILLKDQFRARKMHGNSTPHSERSTNDTTVETTVAEPNVVEPTIVGQKKKGRPDKHTLIQQLMDLERTKMVEWKRKRLEKDEDPDFLFMSSLVPYLRKVTEERKQLVRTKLQNIFCEEDELQRIDALGQSADDQYIFESCGRTLNNL